MRRKPGKVRKLNEQRQPRAKIGGKPAYRPPSGKPSRPVEDLLHKLQVRQTELEVQNKVLRKSRLSLEKSRDRYADLYEYAPVGYLTLTRDALINEINLTGAALLGDERNKLIRRRFATYVSSTDRDRWNQIFVRALQLGEQQRFELVLQRANGSRFHAQLEGLRRSERNSAPTVRLAFTDITKLKFAEDELRRQKNLMWQVIDMDHNMIFVRDEAGRFLLANQSIADYYGVAIRNLIGKKNTHIKKDKLEMLGFLASDREVIEHQREVTSTESALMPDGKQHWYLAVKRPLLQADGSVNTLGIAVDISELKFSESKLAESYRELQRLVLHLENIKTEERTAIARNLHDEMGAILAALNMRVAWLASRLPDGMRLLSAEVHHISELVSDGIQTLRQVVSDLRPNLLDDIGLQAAVKDYAKRFQRDTEIECAVLLPELDFSLDENQSVTVFRIIQESLNNVAKHAQASKVEIVFSLRGNSLQLLIRDNGIGFEPTQKSRSFGLLGIKERALMIGGRATIDSAPGQGTCVTMSTFLPTHGQIELDYS